MHSAIYSVGCMMKLKTGWQTINNPLILHTHLCCFPIVKLL